MRFTLCLASLLFCSWPLQGEEEMVDQWGPFADWVTSVAATPDGTQFYAGSYDEFRVWNATDAREASKQRLNTGFVRSLSVSPDGTLLAVGGYKRIEIWSLKDQLERKQTLNGHRGYVTGVKFLDEETLLSVSEDKSLKRWNLSTKQATATHEFTQSVQGFDVHETLVCVALGDNTRAQIPGSVEVLKRDDFSVVHSLKDAKAPVLVARIIASQNRVVSGGIDEKIFIHDLQTGKLERSFSEHSRPVNDIALSADGAIAISGSGGRFKGKNEVIVWETLTGKVHALFEPHPERITAVAFGKEGMTAFGSYDKTVSFWTIGALKEMSDP